MFEVLTRIYSHVQRLWIISTSILQGEGGICESYVEVIYVNDCMPIMYMILNSMDVWHSPFMLALT